MQHEMDDPSMPEVMEHKRLTLTEVKADSQGPGSFTGYAAVFGNVDAYGDVIARGAFKETLKDWEAKGKYPPMLLQHGGFLGGAEDLLSIGAWTTLTENSHGLKGEGRIFNLDTDLGKRIYTNMKEGQLGLSIGFFTRQMKLGSKPGEPARTLLDIDLKEVSLVTFPANEQAVITAVKSLSVKQKRELEEALRDEGFSQRQRLAAVSIFQDLIQRDAGGAMPNRPRDEGGPDLTTVLQAMQRLHEDTWAEVLKASLAH